MASTPLPPVPESLHIGIDAGDSATELAAAAGDASTTCSGPAIDLRRKGLGSWADSLAALIVENVKTPEHVEGGSICVGIPGAGRLFDQATLGDLLRERLGAPYAACAVLIEDQAHLALEAAFDGSSGMAVLAGQSATVMARSEEDDLLRVGGWGDHIGDEGSAVAIGTTALRAIAADFDGGEPTVLRARCAERYGWTSPDDLVRSVGAEHWEGGTLAPLVMEAAESGDWVCTRILKTQANALAQRAGWVATRATAPITPRIVLSGGLTDETYYYDCLTDALLRHLPQWRVVRPAHPPVYGALARARQHVPALESGD